jgi:hypothetical protein
VAFEQSKESQLVKHVAKSWLVKPELPSLHALKYSLTNRLADIWRIGSQEMHRSPVGRGDRIARVKFLHLPLLTSATAIIEVFNELIGDTYGRWALLFDELEIMPTTVRDLLLSSIRSVDERWFFKLSITPSVEDLDFVENIKGAMPANDFESVSLWYPRKDDSYEFTLAMFEQLLRAEQKSVLDPRKILGRSEFDLETNEARKAKSRYYPDSPIQRRFVSLEAKDPSFREYLRSNKIDLRNLHRLSEEDRAAKIRKIAPLVIVRDEYFKVPPPRWRRQKGPMRTRKAKRFYSGAESLFAITEGNPRWIKGIFTPLVAEMGKAKIISRIKQQSALNRATDGFRALLKTIPCEAIGPGPRPQRVLTIIDIIGKYFFDRITAGRFDPDVVGTFRVDKNCSQDIVDSLREALNAGAIVYVQERDDPDVLDSLHGIKFRLSYLLAHHHRLPLRLGRDASLLDILAKHKQIRLFD